MALNKESLFGFKNSFRLIRKTVNHWTNENTFSKINVMKWNLFMSQRCSQTWPGKGTVSRFYLDWFWTEVFSYFYL